MKKLVPTLLIAVAAVMLSSCVIIHPEDEDNPFCHKKETNTTEVTNTTTETNQTSVTPNGRYSITFRNSSNNTITEWFVRKDKTQTYSNDGYCHPICSHDYDVISDLPSGEYRIWFMIADEYCFRSEHINLDRDVTYVLITCSTSGYQAEQCRSAVSAAPQFYLEGSDGSIVNVEQQ